MSETETKDRHVMVQKPIRMPQALADRLEAEAKQRGYPHSQNSIVVEVMGRYFRDLDAARGDATQAAGLGGLSATEQEVEGRR